MDPADADAVVAALQARGGRPPRRRPVPEAEREEALASFEKDYGAASRAHVLDVRAHVLGRVAGALRRGATSTSPTPVEGGPAGGAYEHAYERADVESRPVATAGGFLLNLRAHAMRGADGLLHQNPAMDVETPWPSRPAPSRPSSRRAASACAAEAPAPRAAVRVLCFRGRMTSGPFPRALRFRTAAAAEPRSPSPSPEPHSPPVYAPIHKT